MRPEGDRTGSERELNAIDRGQCIELSLEDNAGGVEDW